MTAINVRDIRAEEVDHITHSRVLEVGTDKIQLRFALGVLTALFLYNTFEPAAYILFIEDSLTYKTAALLHANILVGGVFVLCGAMMVPQLFALAMAPGLLGCKAPRRMAAAGGTVGAVLWFLMAYMSKDLDSNWVTPVFAFRAVFYMAISAIYATSLNSQRAREFINASSP